ncbi:hypothetical protein SUNI508_12678 [Seiridium unicorne]|uniref:Uncharacterized protein n=1 Tax=Seiridium unicorne TaxID=138068 RepID=A0ABR2VGT7_9PEZI
MAVTRSQTGGSQRLAAAQADRARDERQTNRVGKRRKTKTQVKPKKAASKDSKGPSIVVEETTSDIQKPKEPISTQTAKTKNDESGKSTPRLLDSQTTVINDLLLRLENIEKHQMIHGDPIKALEQNLGQYKLDLEAAQSTIRRLERQLKKLHEDMDNQSELYDHNVRNMGKDIDRLREEQAKLRSAPGIADTSELNLVYAALEELETSMAAVQKDLEVLSMEAEGANDHINNGEYEKDEQDSWIQRIQNRLYNLQSDVQKRLVDLESTQQECRVKFQSLSKRITDACGEYDAVLEGWPPYEMTGKLVDSQHVSALTPQFSPRRKRSRDEADDASERQHLPKRQQTSTGAAVAKSHHAPLTDLPPIADIDQTGGVSPQCGTTESALPMSATEPEDGVSIDSSVIDPRLLPASNPRAEGSTPVLLGGSLSAPTHIPAAHPPSKPPTSTKP